jgi:uncharacterized protein (DUF2252 family)
MTGPELIHRLKVYNKGRVPQFLALKYAAMRESPFRFMRGSAHLFYEDIPGDCPLLESPKAWICGDLHLENLGSFKGDNGLAYFDLNDFDEAALAPCLLDIARFACSIHVGGNALQLAARGAAAQVDNLLEAYIATLRRGYIRSLEQETATGVVRQFLQKVQTRNRKLFLSGRIAKKKNKPRLVIDNTHWFALPGDRKEEVTAAFRETALYRSDPAFFAVRDVAYRVAGTGSLGMERFVLLVEGKKGINRYYLIDIKEAQAPSLLLRHHYHQPEWPSQASRIIEIQQRVQAAAPALLSTMTMRGKHFVVKELQPVEDKLDLTHLGGRTKRCTQFIATVGTITAWGLLRSSGRQGSAVGDELIGFAHRSDHWKDYVADYAAKYAGKVFRDYTIFCKAYDKDAFK